MTLASPEALALASRPEGTLAIQIESADQWHALRADDVTASVAGALLGVHPRMTPFGLYMVKTGQDDDRSEDAPDREFGDDWWSVSYSPARRGHILEPLAMEEARAQTGWTISYPLSHYWRLPDLRIGATPDAFAIRPDRPGFGIIQFKTVAPDVFNKSWIDPDTRAVVPPAWVLVQAITEARATGASWAAVVVIRLSHRLQITGVDVPLHDGVWQRLTGEVATFWQRVADNRPPEPETADSARIMRMLAEADGPQIDLSDRIDLGELLHRHQHLKSIEAAGNEAAKERRGIDGQLVHALGNAVSAIAPGGLLIEAKTVRRAGYTATPSIYRVVKIKGDTSRPVKTSTHEPESF